MPSSSATRFLLPPVRCMASAISSSSIRCLASLTSKRLVLIAEAMQRAGSLRAGQRAAAVMSLIQSAKLNGHDPHAYLKDVMTRLPTHKASRIGELLPHRWQSAAI